MPLLPPQPDPPDIPGAQPPALVRPPGRRDWRTAARETWADFSLRLPPVSAAGLALTVVAFVVGAVLVAAVLLSTHDRSRSAAGPELSLPLAQPGDLVLPTATPAPLVVHVSGAVARPGVYALVAGQRVADAVAEAGGVVSEADLDRVNLAAVLEDGQRVYIPLFDQLVPPVVTGEAPGAADEPSGPIDLNTADQAQLETLPGIGPSTAAAIVAYRDEHGAFRVVAELQEVPGIGPAKLSQLIGRVVVSG